MKTSHVSQLKKRPESCHYLPCHCDGEVANLFGNERAGLNIWYVKVNPGRSLESHHHPCEEIYFLRKGTGELSIDNEVFSLCEGDFIQIPVNSEHHFSNIGSHCCEIVAISHLEADVPQCKDKDI